MANNTEIRNVLLKVRISTEDLDLKVRLNEALKFIDITNSAMHQAFEHEGEYGVCMKDTCSISRQLIERLKKDS